MSSSSDIDYSPSESDTAPPPPPAVILSRDDLHDALGIISHLSYSSFDLFRTLVDTNEKWPLPQKDVEYFRDDGEEVDGDFGDGPVNDANFRNNVEKILQVLLETKVKALETDKKERDGIRDFLDALKGNGIDEVVLENVKKRVARLL